MAELTNKVEADLVLDRKMDAGRYGGGDLHNYVASQELTVTITLSEYRELVSEGQRHQHRQQQQVPARAGNQRGQGCERYAESRELRSEDDH